MNRVALTMKVAVCALTVGVSVTLAAMPTTEELTKADPLIQELMKDDLNALRGGKKTREQVGDAAAALAKEAQSPAEKYLLFTGAFDQYMRGGSYDKANAALDALRAAIPDWKASDEFALVDKAMRSVAFGKGGPVRERHEALKERQQYALKLKKAQTLAQAKPTDKKLQFQVAAYHAALGEWSAALDGFAAGSNPVCAAAAKLEKESAAPGQTADAWWSASDLKPDFLSSAIRAHAVDLYRKALASNSLAGLQKVAAEKRIAEAESAAAPAKSEKPSSSAIPSVGTAKYYGVELVGNSVKENKGILSGFANKSYAKIKAPFDPKDKSIEAVVELSTGAKVDNAAGVLSAASKCGFSPVLINDGQIAGFLSSNGTAWNIAFKEYVGCKLVPNKTYRMKIKWDGKAYTWYMWEKNLWCKLKNLDSSEAVFGGSDVQFGVDRLLGAPFSGTVDLNRSYICIDGKLLWEGVKGAYKNANK